MHEVAESPKVLMEFVGFYIKKIKPMILQFALNNSIIVALILGIVIGFFFPRVGDMVNFTYNGISPVQTFLLMMVFFINGMQLEWSELRKSINEKKAIAWGLFSILILSVIIGIKCVMYMPFPDFAELQIGLIIYFAVPSSSAACVVLTRQAKGDVTLALLITIMANIIAVFTAPAMLFYMSDLKYVNLNVMTMVLKLSYTVLLPLALGRGLRYASRVKHFVTTSTNTLKMVQMFVLFSVPWMEVSKAKINGSFDDITFRGVAAVLGWSAVVHIIFLIVNTIASKLLRFNVATTKAIVITCRLNHLYL